MVMEYYYINKVSLSYIYIFFCKHQIIYAYVYQDTDVNRYQNVRYVKLGGFLCHMFVLLFKDSC